MLDVRPLVEPRSVAIVEASATAGKAGNVLIRNIRAGKFPGPMYPINPRGGEIESCATYPTIGEAPRGIDLAFLVLGREQTLSAVEECRKAGVKAVCIVTAGFSEGDAWGKNEHGKVKRLIQDAGMVAIGPNTIGTVSMGGKLMGSFVPYPSWTPGSVGICAQTGIFAGAVMLEVMSATRQGLGVHASIDIGNCVGITELDLLEHFAGDPSMDVLGFYLEEIASPREFLGRACEVKTRKPIVVLKPGRTSEGARASASHTGSLMQEDAVIDGLLYQHGLVRAGSVREFLLTLKGFSYGGVPVGDGVGVITYSGALGVIATDELVHAGLRVADLDAGTLRSIQELLPGWQAAANPADLWSAAERNPERTLRTSLDAVLRDRSVDQVLLIMLAVPNVDFEGVGEVFKLAREQHPNKPLHLVLHGGQVKERWVDAVEGLAIPVYDSTADAVRVMSSMARYALTRSRVPRAQGI